MWYLKVGVFAVLLLRDTRGFRRVCPAGIRASAPGYALDRCTWADPRADSLLF